MYVPNLRGEGDRESLHMHGPNMSPCDAQLSKQPICATRQC